MSTSEHQNIGGHCESLGPGVADPNFARFSSQSVDGLRNHYFDLDVSYICGQRVLQSSFIPCNEAEAD